MTISSANIAGSSVSQVPGQVCSTSNNGTAFDVEAQSYKSNRGHILRSVGDSVPKSLFAGSSGALAIAAALVPPARIPFGIASGLSGTVALGASIAKYLGEKSN